MNSKIFKNVLNYVQYNYSKSKINYIKFNYKGIYFNFDFNFY